MLLKQNQADNIKQFLKLIPNIANIIVTQNKIKEREIFEYYNRLTYVFLKNGD